MISQSGPVGVGVDAVEPLDESPLDEVPRSVRAGDRQFDLVERGFVEQFDRIDADTDRTAPAESGE